MKKSDLLLQAVMKTGSKEVCVHNPSLRLFVRQHAEQICFLIDTLRCS